MKFTNSPDPLTPANAKALQPGVVLKDRAVPGLELWGKSSAKVWLLYYRAKSGERRRPKLGEFPAVQVDRAREIARELLDKVAKGDDPSAHWQALRAAPTVEDLAGAFTTWAGANRPQRYQTDTAKAFRTLAKAPLWSMRVSEVEFDHIEAFLKDIRERKYAPANSRPSQSDAPTAMNRMRSLLSKMFNLAETRFKMRAQLTNPVRGTARYTERKRKTHAGTADLPRLRDALEELRPAYPHQVAGIYAILFTGGRVNELMSAKPSQLFGNKLILTSHKTAEHIGDKEVVLPAPALAALARTTPHPSGLLFGDTPLRWVWEKARERAGRPDLQMRDLRRTFATAAKSAGESLEVIGEVFGHTNEATTRRYAWLFDERKEAAAEKVGGKLDALMRGTAAAAPRIPLRDRLKRRPTS